MGAQTYYIAIDLGGTRVKLGLLKNHSLIDKHILMADSLQGLSAHLQSIETAINSLLQKNNIDNKSLSGIGLAFPGIVNTQTKKVLSTNNKYDDAPSLDLQTWFTERWDTDFFLDNDARMSAVGEWKFGAGKGFDNIVSVTIGTGIGSSAIIEGKLLRGKHFQAGCLGGHFTINYKGNICSCGNLGCVEAEASTRSIVNRIINDNSFKKSSLSQVKTIDFHAVFMAAANKDSLASVVKNECLDIWTAGIINLIHAYDPEVIVLGGGILNSKEEIMPYITERVHKYAWCPWGKVEIRASTLMSSAALLGLGYCLQHKI
jgi:glucokinase